MLGGYFHWVLSAFAVAAWLAYLLAALEQRKSGYSWSGRRTLSFSIGIMLLLAGLTPQMAEFAHHDLRGHMLQHLLLGMAAPLGLVFAAPMTLTLRTVSSGARRQIINVLRTPFVAGVSHPVVALILNVGGMYLLYLTPLYSVTLSNPLLHVWLHLHFLLAGCLFTWSIAGPDAAPNRPSIAYRFVVLFISMASHAALAKLMYAYGWPAGTNHGADEIRAAAKLMYYGGDLTELVLLVALLRIWYRQEGKKLQRLSAASMA